MPAALDRPEPMSAAAVLNGLGSEEMEPVGIFPTGFDPLDRVLDGGVRAGDLVLVGGAPGAGKTIAALQWARTMAEAGSTAIYACYEHSEASLLSRLLLLEAAEILPDAESGGAEGLRAVLRSVTGGRRRLDDAVSEVDRLDQAKTRLDKYADRLFLMRASGASSGLGMLGRVMAQRPRADVLFVDYLQKVPAPDRSQSEGERIARVVEGLKEIALAQQIAVVAIVAGDRAGLDSRRLHLHNLRGSSALAYEADVVVLLNEKFRAVSKAHRAYDPVRSEGFKSQVVFTVEKNRDGPAPIDIEFTKDFEHYRFDPEGGYVTEHLVDDLQYLE